MPALSFNAAATASASPDEQLDSLLQGCGVSDLDDYGWVRISGDDRVRWLNGMTTNSILELKAGEGNYNFFLSAQGRIQGDAHAFVTADAILLETSRDRIPALIDLLDRFVIMDDVELANISAASSGIVCAGPTTAAVLSAIGLETANIPALNFERMEWNGSPVTVIHGHSPLVARFELWVEGANASEARAGLVLALTESGAEICTSRVLEHLRILEGTARYGADIRDRDLPQETAQSHALHFAKGCYLGQEIVERIRSRGNVHRTFQSFEIDGDLPPAGTVLAADGKPVGELTSVAAIPLPTGTIQLALGYIRREILDRAVPISYAGGTARPVGAPFVAAERKI